MRPRDDQTKRCIKAKPAVPPLLTQRVLPAAGEAAPRAAEPGALGPAAPEQLRGARRERERSEGRSEAKALVTVQSICSAW